MSPDEAPDRGQARTPNVGGVLVLGMSRSGTSAVTRAFEHAGYYVGAKDQVAGPDADSPLGYYERRDVQATNRELLAELGGSWYAPPSREAQRRYAAKTRPRLERLLDAIDREADGRPIAIKDPRIGVLLQTWLPVAGARLHTVLTLRNPVEIARSLHSRDQLPVPIGLAMWEVHMTGLLDSLAGHAVFVVHYSALIDDPQTLGQTVGEAQAMLDPVRGAAVRPQAAAAGVAVGLRRQRARPDDVRANLTGRQMALYRYLSELPPGRAILDPPPSVRATAEEAAAAVRDRAIWTPGLKARLEAIESSTSWRLTRPVRWLGDLRFRLRSMRTAGDPDR